MIHFAKLFLFISSVLFNACIDFRYYHMVMTEVFTA